MNPNQKTGLIPQVFNYDSHQVEVVMIQEVPHWVAKDVCDILGLSDVSMSIKRLEDDEKLIQTLFVSGQNREVWVVSESGLYNLVFRSNKPEAKKFRKWVTSEVLPTIRKTGKYEMERALSAPEQPAVQELVAELGQRWGGARAVWVDGRYFVCLRQVLMFLGIGSASSDSFLAGIATKDKMLYKAPGQTTRAWYVLEERFVNLPNYMRTVPGIFYEEIAAMKGAKALPVATTAVAKPDNRLQSINRCLYLLGRSGKISADVRTEVMDLLYQLGEKGGQNV